MRRCFQTLLSTATCATTRRTRSWWTSFRTRPSRCTGSAPRWGAAGSKQVEPRPAPFDSALGFQLLNSQYNELPVDEPLSTFAFDFSKRPHSTGVVLWANNTARLLYSSCPLVCPLFLSPRKPARKPANHRNHQSHRNHRNHRLIPPQFPPQVVG
jgi:hypothetical protein